MLHKRLIVDLDGSSVQRCSVDDNIQQHLEDGWKIISVVPMSGKLKGELCYVLTKEPAHWSGPR